MQLGTIWGPTGNWPYIYEKPTQILYLHSLSSSQTLTQKKKYFNMREEELYQKTKL